MLQALQAAPLSMGSAKCGFLWHLLPLCSSSVCLCSQERCLIQINKLHLVTVASIVGGTGLQTSTETGQLCWTPITPHGLS